MQHQSDFIPGKKVCELAHFEIQPKIVNFNQLCLSLFHAFLMHEIKMLVFVSMFL